MISQNRLRLATEEDIPLLTKRTENLLPETLTIYGFFQFGYKYKSVDENRTKIYIPEESSNNPYFIAIVGVAGTLLCTSLTVYWKIGTLPNAVIADYLSSIPNVTWKKAVYFWACHSQILDELEHILIDERLCNPTKKRWKNAKNRLLRMNNKATLNDVKLESGLTLKPLKSSDAKKIVENLHYLSETVENVSGMITNLPSSGIYYKPNGNVEEELVSWILTKHDGEIGMTTTEPNFRGKKLATIVTNDIIRKHQSLGHTPYVSVIENNQPGLNLHKKIGFVDCSSVGYEMYQDPNNDSEEQKHFKKF